MSNAVGDKGLLLLAESPNLSKLESLNLENTGITALGVLALSRSSHLNQLRELNLCGNDLREKGLHILLNSLLEINDILPIQIDIIGSSGDQSYHKKIVSFITIKIIKHLFL